jgi:CrcB protein
MTKVLFLLAGGAIGTGLRYYISGLAYRVFDWTFPVGTFVVNVFGSFVIGLLWGLFEEGHLNISPNIRTFLFIGILGGFTTFSSYMLETLNLFRDGETRLAFYNLLANNIIGIVLVFTGYLVAREIITILK